MFKKIILGAVLVGVIGVLIVGAVIRTSATSGERAGEGGRRGQATEVAAAGANGQSYGGGGSEASPGGSGRGGRWAQGSTEQALGGQGSGLGAQSEQAGTGVGTGTGQGLPQADITGEDWTVVTGAVVSVAPDLIEIRTDAGEVIPFEGRPLSFAAEQGFGLKVGDPVTLDGYDENGEFKIGKVTNLNGGASVTLRDASGRPGWAGRGRQG